MNLLINIKEVIPMRKNRITVTLDVDDVLYECIPYAIKLANEKYKYNPPIDIKEVDGWGRLNKRTDVIFEFFQDENFFRNQPIMPGAKDFISELSKYAEVVIVTATAPKFMSIRAQRITEDFPEIKPENIIISTRKDLVKAFITLDDGAHNISNSSALYPVLLRKPWNKHLTGLLSVNNYQEFMTLFNTIISSNSNKIIPLNEARNVVLIGPSGSDKQKVAEKYEAIGFHRIPSYTTNPHLGKPYKVVSVEEFHRLKDNGEFIETTTYGDYEYGVHIKDVDKTKRNVMVMDICGAMAMKNYLPQCTTVYVKASKEKILQHILEMDAPQSDKLRRIMSLEAEMKNEEICDHVISLKY